MILLSEKAKDFLKSPFKIEVLEGVTSSGKTTLAADIKLVVKVMESDRSQHILAGRNVGVLAKNIIESDLGILRIWGDAVEFYPNGKGSQKMPHVIVHSPKGDKIIYVVSYNNISSWKTLLGGQYGVVYIDECNIANIEFINEISARFTDWMCMSLNPDAPTSKVYTQYINHCRPMKKWSQDVPKAIMEDLKSVEAKPGWCYWFFDFKDNAALTEDRIQQIKDSVPEGTTMYKNKILGLRTRAQGLVYSNFSRKRHILNKNQLKKDRDEKKVYFLKYSAGLDTSYSTSTEDTLVFTFSGITQKSESIILDELVLKNNKNNPFAPSDIVKIGIEFLEKNRKEWGMPVGLFIDSGDAATLQEFLKFKRTKGSIYQFESSHKKLEIIDRINLILGWLHSNHFFVCDDCEHTISEFERYSWSEKDGIPEDRNNHCLDSLWYSIAPLRTYIGTKVY